MAARRAVDHAGQVMGGMASGNTRYPAISTGMRKLFRWLGHAIQVIVEWPVYLGLALVAAARRAPRGRTFLVSLATIAAFALFVFYLAWLLSPPTR